MDFESEFKIIAPKPAQERFSKSSWGGVLET